MWLIPVVIHNSSCSHCQKPICCVQSPPRRKRLEFSSLLAQSLLAAISSSCCAGASEARNLGYMTRLGLWGEGVPAFPDFATFLDAMDSKGVAAFELVAMDMKVCFAFKIHWLSKIILRLSCYSFWGQKSCMKGESCLLRHAAACWSILAELAPCSPQSHDGMYPAQS